MNKSKPTIEGLLADPSFIDHCLNDDVKQSDPWSTRIENNPEDEIVYVQAKEMVLLLTGKMPESLIEAKLGAFKKRFYEVNPKQKSRYNFRTDKRSALTLFSGIAASLFLIAGIIFFLRNSAPKQEYAFNDIKGKTITTPFTERNLIKLSDGTEAILYPGSKLIISEDFNSDDRKIAISGQVYLKVFSNKAKPFVVYSKHTTTTAIGTAFYVRDFEKGNLSSVLLVAGKVKVNEPTRKTEAFLEPGTTMVVDNATLKTQKRKIDNEQLKDLTEFKLDLNNSDMKAIVNRLELFYGVQIDLSACNCQFKRLTGDYSKKSLSAILNSISFTNQVSWEIRDQKIVFLPGPNKP
ncbi:FecR family protein [Pedobacter nyackensis]|uniref:FecR family protein n=1 Tax=Pedobacter nyackensis TaxID=475255 RepID=UPI002930FC39|nr:FecR family protein [Pedobacter nyackensis]